MTASRVDVSIDLPPRIDLIPTVRLMLRRALPVMGSDNDSLYFGAVTEILANAMQAHAAIPERPICVDVSLTGRPTVTITDFGPGFDPDDPPEPTRQDGQFGRGRGLTIARFACPDLTITSSERGTTVALPFGPEVSHP